MKVCFYTLGCKVNQHETGAMQQLFGANGYEICDAGDKADIYVVNSCTVTAGGDKKSLQWLRRAKRENPNAVTVLCGCYPQAFPAKAAESGADIILGNTNRSRILQDTELFLKSRRQIIDIAPHLPGEKFEELPAESFAHRTRAFMKIEDGCNRACAYCIIPTARGRVRSRTPESILAEVSSLCNAGYREIVFSGINLSCYGIDIKYSFKDIINDISKNEQLRHIRLGSIEPDLLPFETLQSLSRVEKLCPQFHLSLQSGCAATLKRMNRMYTPDEYAKILADMRLLFNNPMFTTDVIVGFPGETEEEFAESVEFVKRCRFLKVHVFGYSPRPGTKAAAMPNQIPNEVKAERTRIMIAAAEKVRSEVIAEMYGTEDEVLLEQPDENGFFTGYTTRYVPVVVSASGHKQGDIVKVKTGKYQNGKCLCTVL